MPRLYDLAHCRAGDKGNTSILSLIAYRPGDYPLLAKHLVRILIRLGRYDEARTEIESLAEASPRDPRLWMKLGAVYYEQKQWDRAIDAFKRVLTLEPTNLRARFFLATTYMDAGRDEDARSELQRVLRVDPRSVDARVQLGFLHGRAKRYDEAIAVLREAINLEPKKPELFLYLGSAYFRAKQYDRAGDYAQRARKLALEQLSRRKLDAEPSFWRDHEPNPLGPIAAVRHQF